MKVITQSLTGLPNRNLLLESHACNSVNDIFEVPLKMSVYHTLRFGPEIKLVVLIKERRGVSATHKHLPGKKSEGFGPLTREFHNFLSCLKEGEVGL